jgi:hypothetical protein
MRVYSRRERLLFALLGALIFLPFSIFMTYLLASMPRLRSADTVWAFLGGWAGTIICFKIAYTARSTAILERPVGLTGLRSAQESSDPTQPNER